MSIKIWGEVGRKGIACSQSQTFYRTSFAHERGAIALLARQSKYDIRNLYFMHNPTSGTQQDQNRYVRLKKRSKRFLRISCSGNVERRFAKPQTHLSKTGARSCYKRLVRRQYVLPQVKVNAVVSAGCPGICMSLRRYALKICFEILKYFGNMYLAIYCAAG